MLQQGVGNTDGNFATAAGAGPGKPPGAQQIIAREQQTPSELTAKLGLLITLSGGRGLRGLPSELFSRMASTLLLSGMVIL